MIAPLKEPRKPSLHEIWVAEAQAILDDLDRRKDNPHLYREDVERWLNFIDAVANHQPPESTKGGTWGIGTGLIVGKEKP